MNIFLIGFMGAGKTTIGKKLARELGLFFYDLDQLIEDKEQLKIADLFELKGEKEFRAIERDMLRDVCLKKDFVLSTGGGAPCYFDNMDRMNESGISIYLQLSAKALASRLEKGQAQRPLIKNLNDIELLEFIEKKLEERENYYKNAKLCINGLHASTSEIINLLN